MPLSLTVDFASQQWPDRAIYRFKGFLNQDAFYIEYIVPGAITNNISSINSHQPPLRCYTKATRQGFIGCTK